LTHRIRIKTHRAQIWRDLAAANDGLHITAQKIRPMKVTSSNSLMTPSRTNSATRRFKVDRLGDHRQIKADSILRPRVVG
jgi:hypothetical protein